MFTTDKKDELMKQQLMSDYMTFICISFLQNQMR